MDRVGHFEIPFADNQRATSFHAAVLRGQISDAPGEMTYSFVMTTPVDEYFPPREPGGINGGMYPRGDKGGRKSPVVVIEFESFEKQIADVERAGGSKVLGPQEIPHMGIDAQIKDREGNMVGPWQPLRHGTT